MTPQVFIGPEAADAQGVHDEPGWAGAFTRLDAPGAPLKAGARVRKIAHDKRGDMTPDGTLGTVLGSVGPMSAADQETMRQRGVPHPPTYLYFVEWDGRPKTAIGCGDWKIERA